MRPLELSKQSQMNASRVTGYSVAYVNAVYAVCKLPLRLNILGSKLIVNVFFIDIPHLANEFTLIVIFVAVVI